MSSKLHNLPTIQETSALEVLSTTTYTPNTTCVDHSTMRDTTATFINNVPGLRNVKFSNSDERGWVTIENAKVSTSGQGKGAFNKRPLHGCTIELPDNLSRALTLEAAQIGCLGTLSRGEPLIGRLMFACKRLDETTFVSVEPAEYLDVHFHEYANITSLSTEYPLGFVVSGKFSFRVLTGLFPIIVMATIHEGTITGTTAIV
jgi:hypothetical protein